MYVSAMPDCGVNMCMCMSVCMSVFQISSHGDNNTLTYFLSSWIAIAALLLAIRSELPRYNGCQIET